MPGFPFLKLPLLAQLTVLEEFDHSHLINLSFCSERTRAIVETANVQLDNCAFDYGNSGTLIRLVRCYIHFIVCTLGEPSGTIVKSRWFRNREGQVVLFQTAQSMRSVQKLLTDHMMRTFRAVKHVDVTYSDLPILDLPVWKYTKSIGRLWCSTRTEGEILREEMEFILNELTIDDTLIIEPPVADGFRYLEGFVQKEVNIHHGNWIQFDAILNSASRSISLKQIEKPPAALLNTFLKLWMAKEKMENLKELRLELQTGHNFSKEFRSQVLDGIVYERRPYSGYYNIQRLDGKSALLEISDTLFHLFGFQ